MNATAKKPTMAPGNTRGRPLLPLRGVVALIDRNEDEVLRLIEDGDLLWAFNLALDPKRAHRMMLHVLPEAVADYLDGRRCELEWAEVLHRMLPHDEPLLRTKEITRSLNLSSVHVFALIRRGLKTKGKWHVGRKGSAMFTRESVVTFLRRRCWPFPVPDN